ncbi:DUF4307 domain-containing protein [Glaciibacter sp. 2TAF33]|uniref:DUF4307 domain-containing protein n=1 Tax=Glaciibacter sp. 2TAF33 TaxID=3233015 RepID=UPI003F923F32
MAVSSDLDTRYGRSRNHKKRDRTVLWILACVFVVVFGAWVVWAGLDAGKPVIETRDLGYTIVDDNLISIDSEVSAPTDTAMSCAVQALNQSFTVVGWKVIDLPPSKKFTRTFTVDLRTSELSTTGLIYRCWLT